MTRFALPLTLLLCLVLAGCTTYYKIHDPSTGSTYYSTEIEEEDGGAVSLKDARTNAQVTIQNSEIMELTPDQYDAAIRQVEVPAAPAPDAAPQAAPADGGSGS